MGKIETEDGELALIKRAAAGDHEAFRCLVLSYEGKLLAYLTQMLGDVENAHDIAQETFIAAFHALPRWHLLLKPSTREATATHEESESSTSLLAPWLYRIATNRALSLIRKQQVRHRTLGQLDVEEAPWQGESQARQRFDTPALLQNPIEEHYIARELLRQALSQLSEDDAACLILHYVSGERYNEIASRLGLTSEAVRKRTSRALAVLRKVYFALDKEVRT